MSGVTSYIKVTQYVSAASNPNNPAFTIQDGALEGAVISIGIQATNTQTLRLSNVNVAGSIGTGNGTIAAEDAIGQIDTPSTRCLRQRALIVAVVNRLNEDEDNNNIAAVNLTASASQITDLNVAGESTEYTKLQILVQVECPCRHNQYERGFSPGAVQIKKSLVSRSTSVDPPITLERR